MYLSTEEELDIEHDNIVGQADKYSFNHAMEEEVQPQSLHDTCTS